MLTDSVVIGYGNTLRGDDGVGPAVAERVRRLQGKSGPEVLIRQVLTPDLAGDIAGKRRVVLIDASIECEPGTIREVPISPQINSNAVMVHSLSPAELLGFCLRTYGSAPEGILVTVGGFQYELGAALSSQLRRLLRPLVRRTLELLG